MYKITHAREYSIKESSGLDAAKTYRQNKERRNKRAGKRKPAGRKKSPLL
jgi:hypothetical protein